MKIPGNSHDASRLIPYLGNERILGLREIGYEIKILGNSRDADCG